MSIYQECNAWRHLFAYRGLAPRMLKLSLLPPAPKNCGICKSKRHKLPHFPTINKFEHVAVRRQFAASSGFCFNCGVGRPGYGSGSCPKPSACSKCPVRHLSLLLSDKAQDGRRPNPPNNKESHAKGDKPPVTPNPTGYERANAGKFTSANSVKPETIPISSAGLSTSETQVLLNVVPVCITAANGNAVSTYAFLDSGCIDTLIDRDLVDHLGIQGRPKQIGINTITSSGKVVESNRVSFTLSSLESFGESIEVSEAYILPDLNQSQRTLPEQIDVHNYPHLCDIEFPAVDIKRVSILVGNNITYAHIQKEVRVPEDKKKDSMVVVTPLISVSVVAMAARTPREPQWTLPLLILLKEARPPEARRSYLKVLET